MMANLVMAPTGGQRSLTLTPISGAVARAGATGGLSASAVALLLYVLAALAGCATTTAPHVVTPAQTQRFGQNVNDLAAPAMQGRGVGTAGLERARDYLVQQFERCGLEPAFKHDATLAFTQPFEVSTGVRVKQQALTFGDDQPFDPGVDFNALGLSANGDFQGEAVFVGYGVTNESNDYDSYASFPIGSSDSAADTPARAPLKGMVAVTYRYEPMDDQGDSRWAKRVAASFIGWSHAATFMRKAELAAGHGAAALLVVDPPTHDIGANLVTTANTVAATAPIPVLHIKWRVFERMLAKYTDQPRMMAKQLQTRADQGRVPPMPLGPVQGSVELERPRSGVDNVAAVLPGSGELADQVVVVGAHYDHLGYGEFGSLSGEKAIHPGADDNASGTAGLLMLAETLTGRAADLPNRRTILFLAFTAEERGLLGSAHLVKHLDELGIEPAQITAMLNMDMIGRLEKNRLFVFGIDSGDQWKPLLHRANRSTRLKLELNGTAIGASDHTQFYVKDIPVLHFFTGAHRDYHRPSDTPDKVNTAGGARVVNLIEALLIDLATMARPMTFVPDKSLDSAGLTARSHGGARLGIMPDYGAGSDGCAIQVVMANTPAAQAGLQDGDVIQQWNDRKISNVHDLTAALQQSKPGDKATLKVRRQDETFTLNVTLGSR